MELEKLLKLHEQLEKATQIAREEIVKQINSWQSLADMGFTIEAIKFYRKQHNVFTSEFIWGGFCYHQSELDDRDNFSTYCMMSI